MSEVIKGISNERLLGLTNMVAGQPATFNADADQTTEADVAAAKAEALRYAEARNKNASPKSLAGLDTGLVASVKAWCANRGKRLRG
jgi:hypothetical protein